MTLCKCVLGSFLFGYGRLMCDLISYLLYYHLMSFLITWRHTSKFFCLLLFLARPDLHFASLYDLFDKKSVVFLVPLTHELMIIL